MSMTENLENMLAAGQDNAMLRYSLGSAHLKEGEAARAVDHLQQALAHDPEYSAAWKVYGMALTEVGRTDAALHAYATGIQVAERKGDRQAAKEMTVFHKRLLTRQSS